MGKTSAKNRTYQKRSLLFVVMMIFLLAFILSARLGYLMIYEADHYGVMAKELHQRERGIKAARGCIYDANGIELAGNKPVCTISVIHSQIKDPENVIRILTEKLGLPEEKVRKRVEKISSIERIKSNVDKETADEIRQYDLAGVMIDEDYKRYYPLGNVASRVLGFTGNDNQGIIGLEVKYESILKGTDGKILTMTTAGGTEIKNAAEDRIEPIAGKNLYLSLDVNIQKYAMQAAQKVLDVKQAKNVKFIAMNPQNGEIYAMVNLPEFDLNNPYTFNNGQNLSPDDKGYQDALNEMWRNACVSDTYEPGSTFKVITATAALEDQKVTLKDTFSCPGFKIVEDRRIRCHKTAGHGAETFVQGIQNSCNPVFIEIGARVGTKRMFYYYRKLGLFEKTGIDIPGEANSIMHKEENVGEVELATMSFGQSIQITPLQLLVAVSSVINGGKRVTPHFGVKVVSADGTYEKKLTYPVVTDAVSSETSETMKALLESVVSEGGGKQAYIEGYRIGGKTATSEKLPRSSKRYISSFLGFAPADNPNIIAIVLIDEPQGIYYGGTIAAPVVREVYENVLPYLEGE